MNTFWLKVAGAVVGIVVVIVIVSAIMPSGDSSPKPTDRSFYDVADEDKDKYLNAPKRVDPTPGQPDVSDEQPSETNDATSPREVTLYFSELSEIDKIEAERLLNVAAPGYSIGRLPVTGYNLALQMCRQIIEKWPDSWYAYRAKQMLGDIPQRLHLRYRITEEELDVSMYSQQRQGTVAFVDKKAN